MAKIVYSFQNIGTDNGMTNGHGIGNIITGFRTNEAFRITPEHCCVSMTRTQRNTRDNKWR